MSQDKTKSSGSLYGYVYNASQTTKTEGTPGLAAQEVVLHRYVDGKAEEGAHAHTITDAYGRFEFNDLEVGKRFAYYPVSVLAGIEYDGGLVTLTADSLLKRSDVLVFEPTRSDSSISVAMQHIIITPGAGALNVKEVLVFTNRDRYTYVGHAPAGPQGKNIVLRLEVPEGAREVQFGSDLMSCCAVVNGNEIFDTMALKPGVRQEVVSYLLPYKGREVSLVKENAHPTAELDVFLPQNSGTLKAPGFTSQGSFEIRGENYQRFTAANLHKGSLLILAITNLPAAPRDWRWLPPAVFVVLVLTGFGIYRWRRKSGHSGEEADEEKAQFTEINKERQRLLEEILQLDDAYEAGNIDENTYSTAREKLKEIVLALDAQKANQPAKEMKQNLEGVNHENR